MSRWLVTCIYRTDAGTIDVEHHIDELIELHELIERGPDWHALDHIKIELNHPETTTIEAARFE